MLAGLGYDTNTTPPGFAQSVQFLASGSIPGIIEPGETETVPVYYGGWLTSQWNFSRPPIIFSVSALYATNTQTIDWDTYETALEPFSINTAAWGVIFPILIEDLGSTWGQYVQTLDNDAFYLASIGEPTDDLAALLSFEIAKANAEYTVETLGTVTIDDLPAPGIDLNFTLSFHPSISARYVFTIIGVGWTDDWDETATTLPDGGVEIDDDGCDYDYNPLPDGGYEDPPGDEGTTLTDDNGTYELTQPDGDVDQFNPNGTLEDVEDPDGNEITCGYNGSDDLDSLTDPDGDSINLDYNSDGEVDMLTDSTGQTVTLDYNSSNELTSYTTVSGTTTFTYVTGQSAAQNGALAGISYANGTSVFFKYDSVGRLSTSTKTTSSRRSPTPI